MAAGGAAWRGGGGVLGRGEGKVLGEGGILAGKAGRQDTHSAEKTFLGDLRANGGRVLSSASVSALLQLFLAHR